MVHSGAEDAEKQWSSHLGKRAVKSREALAADDGPS
jgi:hypothetical protein